MVSDCELIFFYYLVCIICMQDQLYICLSSGHNLQSFISKMFPQNKCHKNTSNILQQVLNSKLEHCRNAWQCQSMSMTYAIVCKEIPVRPLPLFKAPTSWSSMLPLFKIFGSPSLFSVPPSFKVFQTVPPTLATPFCPNPTTNQPWFKKISKE